VEVEQHQEHINMDNNITIQQVNPVTFEFQQYTEQDNILISSSRLDTAFTSSTDYIEYYAYDENKTLIYPSAPNIKAVSVNSYSVINGDTILYPNQDLENIGYDYGSFYSTYNFYRYLLDSNITVNYYISEISSDRTEVRLKSNTIADSRIISSSNDFISSRENSEYFVDFLLNFGNDQQCIANNIKLDTESEVEPSILVKLYEPLPVQFGLKSTLWVVEEISAPQAYNVTFPFEEFIPNDFQFILGPNYSLNLTQESGVASQVYDYNSLIGTNLTSSANQVKNLLNRKEVSISVDYTDYNDFIQFSSAYTRLENFVYKVGLIEQYQNTLNNILSQITDGGTGSIAYSESNAEFTSKIAEIEKNFDGYEYFLYYNSGSEYSYPKSNTEPPFTLYSTGSSEVLTWLGSADPSNAYYGGQSLSASNYDEENDNYLKNTIPEYLKTDPNNAKYELFVDMVAQQYDNTWLYTKNITTRFDADNRLDYGISKDLVADAIKDFGIKLYSNNFNTDDLYTAFLGITPSGSTFPFPYMTGSINGKVDTPSGYEYVDTEISASDDIVPLDNVNKRLYKRIYHNLPNLLKRKGTIGGLRALITSYGIPDTILRISEFGSKDRDTTKDWDYSQNQFNYALQLEGISNPTYITSSWAGNSAWPNVDTSPQTVQLRFKTTGIPTSSFYQNLFVLDYNNAFITLEYDGNGTISGSWSGSVPSESNAYGTLAFYPEGQVGYAAGRSASVSLPFFDQGWWSVQATYDYDNTTTASLYVANRIGEEIGFSGSDHIAVTQGQYWKTATTAYIPSASNLILNSLNHAPLSGALQEVRYWDTPLSESFFFDYVVNPYSTQGTGVNTAPDELMFRADLGTELNTGSRTSIHPKVTGSWEITQSFASDSNFYLTGSFIQNTESIFLNQVPGGIKNRITDKVHIVTTTIPSGSTLSPYRSIQQTPYPSGSAPNINYLEVAFSPQDQINDDIIAQVGDFNLGDYIGDPRQISESTYSYPELDALRDAYFTKYIKSYDVNDFVRLIKFFDNSLFKMIEDFTPARTSLSSGVVIKQNLLERNKQAPPSMSFSIPEYSGSVKSAPRDYEVYYTEVPTYFDTAQYTQSGALISNDLLSFNSVDFVGITPGGSYVTGSELPITGSVNGVSGSGATFQLHVDSGNIKSVSVINTGSDYYRTEEITINQATLASTGITATNDIVITLDSNNLALAKTAPNFPQYANVQGSGSSIEVFDGGTGGVFEPYNSLYTAPISASDQKVCFDNYFFTSSNSELDIPPTVGSLGFTSTVGTATNTMSINISQSDGQAIPQLYLQQLYSASMFFSQSCYVQLDGGVDGMITHEINFMESIEGGGFGDADYSDGTEISPSLYGQEAVVKSSGDIIFHLTVTENYPAVSYIDNEALEVCFIIGGLPTTGLTNNEISGSMFWKLYPGFSQGFEEYSETTLGIGSPNTASKTLGAGQGQYTLPRIDQREFYNGEFQAGTGSLPVGLKDICSTFFGQDAIVDYQFFIQWFNEATFTEDNFLSPEFQPLAGNVWFWADTLTSSLADVLLLGEELPITQSPYTVASSGPIALGVITGVGSPTATGYQTQAFTIGQHADTSVANDGSEGYIGTYSSSTSPDGGVSGSLLTNASGDIISFYPSNLAGGNPATAQVGQTINFTEAYLNSTSLGPGGTGDAEFVLKQANVSVTSYPASSASSAAWTPTVSQTTSISGSGIEISLSQSIQNGTPIMTANILNIGANYAVGDTFEISTTDLATLDPIIGAVVDQSLIVALEANNFSTPTQTVSNKVKYIKMSFKDVNGELTRPYINTADYVTFTFTNAADYLNNAINGFQTYYIGSATNQPSNNLGDISNLLNIFSEASSDAITSFDTQTYDLSFSASGDFIYQATQSGDDPLVILESGLTSSIPQGYFPPEAQSFPTESFIRGWGQANYYKATPGDSTIFLTTSSGFYHDPFGFNNFTTSSREYDYDGFEPYTQSVLPWFINVTASTTQILDNSSLVGNLGTTDLQLYTGSITASTVELGLGFDVFTTPSPSLANIGLSPLVVPQPPGKVNTLFNGVGFYSWEPQYQSGGTITVDVVGLGGANVQYLTSINYVENLAFPASNWLSVTAPVTSTPNTITLTCSSISPGIYPSNGAFVRSAYVVLTPFNNYGTGQSSQILVQQWFTSNNSNGFGATIDSSYFN
jgi:hypothetical protein